MSISTKFAGLAAVPLLLAVAGCGSSRGDAAPAGDAEEGAATETPAPVASAELQTADGTNVGTVRITNVDGGLMLNLTAQGLPPGEHGVHVHMTGSCEAPDFKSAGGHWNPAGKQHGLENPEGQHAGDMPNLVVGEDGTGSLEYALKGGNAEELLDSDGSAFVIHAGKDDQATDPSGDSGDRIACGVFSAG